MNGLTPLATALLGGGVLGAAYFYGLWLTVRHLQQRRWAALWLLASGALRLALLLGGLFWLAGSDWRQLLAALLGVTLARLLVTRKLGPPHGTAGETA